MENKNLQCEISKYTDEIALLRRERDTLLQIVNRIAGIIIESDIANIKIIDGLNIEKGLKHFANDKEWYLRILRSYTASTRTKLALLEIPYTENPQQYQTTVHGVKGASLGIFADEIGLYAKKLEKAADEGDVEYINKNNPVFLDTAYKFITGLENFFIRLDSKIEKSKKDKPDKALLTKLLAACRIYDMVEIEAAMTEIAKHQYEADDGLVLWLKKNVEEMNYEKIEEKLLADFEN